MQNISDRFNAFLEAVDSAENDAHLRQIFDTLPEFYDTDVPEDPFSDIYRQKQLDLYSKIAGKSYSPENEVSSFDVDTAAVSPFPYRHASSDLVGDHIMAMGFLIKQMALPAGAKILEFGPGWGNTTLALAKMGYDVTAIDIEQNFVDLIKRRAEMEQIDLTVMQGDFSLISTIEEKFDAILFFECFHHAQDHLSIMAGFDRVLKPQGIVCFGSEPINAHFPIPWGLRMDGQSIWAIAKHGWLELGFNIEYFRKALARYGFAASEFAGNDSPLSHAIIARRYDEIPGLLFHYDNGGLLTLVSAIDGSRLKIASGDTGIVSYGPYARLEPGNWLVEIGFADNEPRQGVLSIDVVADLGAVVVKEPDEISLQSVGSQTSFVLSTVSLYQNLEVRLFSNGGAAATITHIRFKRTP